MRQAESREKEAAAARGKSPQSALGVRRAGSVGWGVSCKRPAEASQEANGRVPRETGRQAGEQRGGVGDWVKRVGTLAMD
jgi:hypothetical protein